MQPWNVCCEGFFLQTVMNFLEMLTNLEVQVDRSACIGITTRFGVGRVRHLETRSLWLQQAVAERKAIVRITKGTLHLADLGAKAHLGPPP